MKHTVKAIVAFACTGLMQTPSASAQTDSALVAKIYREALTAGKCYSDLYELCTVAPKRLSGSADAAKAENWGLRKMQEYGFENARLQPVKVPAWERGKTEQAWVGKGKKKKDLAVCSLGGSVGAPAGLSALVVEVKGLEELKQMNRADVEGKIVFFNRPMDPAKINTFDAYGGCVDQRYSGAVTAAMMGAVGSLTRSMTLASDEFPHTGSMHYEDTLPRIPAMAVSSKSADKLSAMLKENPALVLTLKSDCRIVQEDRPGNNVLGEMKGSEQSSQIIAFGGHLDCWDKGQGAHDDGAGIVHSMEALRILKQIGYQPKHTLRCVFFMNEENGLRGGRGYAAEAATSGEVHIAALETDRGGFSPRGFCVDADSNILRMIRGFRSTLEPYGLHFFDKCGAGADISPLKNGENAPFPQMTALGLVPDSQRYFDHHHSDRDTFDQVNKRELELGAAAMAAMIMLLDQHLH